MADLSGKQGGGERLAYPAPPVDPHPSMPAPPPPPPAPLYGAIAVAALALVAFYLGELVWGAILLVAGQGFLSLYLQRAMPYPGPVVNPPPPPPPPYRSLDRTLVAAAIVSFGVAVLSFGLLSRAGFVGGALLGMAFAAGAIFQGAATGART